MQILWPKITVLMILFDLLQSTYLITKVATLIFNVSFQIDFESIGLYSYPTTHNSRC